MMFDPFAPDELFVESDFMEVSDFSDFMEFDRVDRIPDLINDLGKCQLDNCMQRAMYLRVEFRLDIPLCRLKANDITILKLSSLQRLFSLHGLDHTRLDFLFNC